MDAKRATPSHITIKIPKVKDKERILKSAREKKLVTCREVPTRLSTDFSKKKKKHVAGLKGLARNIQSHEKQDLQPTLLYPANTFTRSPSHSSFLLALGSH